MTARSNRRERFVQRVRDDAYEEGFAKGWADHTRSNEMMVNSLDSERWRARKQYESLIRLYHDTVAAVAAGQPVPDMSEGIRALPERERVVAEAIQNEAYAEGTLRWVEFCRRVVKDGKVTP
jgi:hypothetical protein